MPEERLWTIDDLAEFLNKPKSWVYEHYRDMFPYIRLGQQPRFDPAEIRATLANLKDPQ